MTARWLFLRGLTREVRHWGGFPDVFRRRARASEIACLDLPGVGTEAHRMSPRTIAGITDDLRRRSTQVRDGRPLGLLAISLGGMIALDWCARYPQDFARAVLINTSAADLAPPHLRMRLGVLPALVRSVIARDLTEKEIAILAATTARHARNAELAKTWAEYRRERPLAPGTTIAQIYAALRFRAPARVEVPTLVLSSAGDRFVHPIASVRLAQRLAAAHRSHTDAGHDLTLDDPEWVSDRVAEWLGLSEAAA